MEPCNSSIANDLPNCTSWGGAVEVLQFEGFWYPKRFFAGVLATKSNFKAHDDDVILASSMKTGTTWLKAIIPCIINHGDDKYDPFLQKHPNELMPSLEIQIFGKNPNPDLSSMPSPRLLRTHVPYQMLPDSVKNSRGCKIVYITREPKDVFVSLWNFMNTKISPDGREQICLNEAFDSFCDGIHPFGPFCDHVLSYWKESLKCPEKIHFIRYEDLKIDPVTQVQRLASFLGKSMEREEVEKLMRLCNLDRLRNLEINKCGVDPYVGLPYKAYFRRGVIGDWKNCLSEEMQQRLDTITKKKLEDSGLVLKL